MNRYILAAVAALVPVSAFAHDAVAVEDAYVRSTNPQSAAAFMVLDNHRDVACRLTAVSSDAAERVELHTHKEEDGVMKMMKVEEGFGVEPHGQHPLARGGDHVMMMGLTTPLADGDTVKLSLDFGDCGTVEVDAPVDNQRAPEAAPEGEAVDHSGH